MQLVAYGAQDVYLTGNPQITFFKVVYRRHTNFSVEAIQQTFNGNADYGRTVTCSINRNGDLITKMHLVVEQAEQTHVGTWGFVRRLGHALIDDVKVEIGGSKIDEQYGDWINIWYELTNSTGHQRGYDKMIGDVPELTDIAEVKKNNTTNVITGAKPAYTMYVPLCFWFCRNNGLALPLIALQYHDVRVTMKFRDSAELVNYVGTTAPSVASLSDAYLLIDYVYLDSEERKRFAQASHEYLIEQVQFTGSESISSSTMKYRLNFNHPSKFLVWASHLDRYTSGNQFVSTDRDPFAKMVWFASRLSDADSINFAKDNEATPANPAVTATGLLATVAGRVNAQLIFSNDADGDNDEVTDYKNVVLLENNVTMEDMSKTVAQLAGGSNAQTWLKANGVTIRDHFNYGNYIDGSDNTVIEAKLQLNGHERFQERDGHYFNYVQPYHHFSGTPADGINVYSFALNPVEHQPSGTCNFSRIDNTTLNVNFGRGNATDSNYLTNYIGDNSSSTLNIYTVNYNVLRIMSGMGGLAYSN